MKFDRFHLEIGNRLWFEGRERFRQHVLGIVALIRRLVLLDVPDNRQKKVRNWSDIHDVQCVDALLEWARVNPSKWRCHDSKTLAGFRCAHGYLTAWRDTNYGTRQNRKMQRMLIASTQVRSMPWSTANHSQSRRPTLRQSKMEWIVLSPGPCRSRRSWNFNISPHSLPWYADQIAICSHTFHTSRMPVQRFKVT